MHDGPSFSSFDPKFIYQLSPRNVQHINLRVKKKDGDTENVTSANENFSLDANSVATTGKYRARRNIPSPRN